MVGILTLVGMLAFIAIGFFGLTTAVRMSSMRGDPAVRTGKSLEVLGLDKLPAGLHAMRVTSLPWVMDTVILSDRPPDESGMIHGFNERGFIYVNFLRFGPDKTLLRDYLEGRTPDPKVLQDNGITVQVEEVLSRGRISRESGDLIYVGQRGVVGARGFETEGVHALVFFDCEDREGTHLAVWMGPRTAPGSTGGSGDISGTPADEQALSQFLEPFDICLTG